MNNDATPRDSAYHRYLDTHAPNLNEIVRTVWSLSLSAIEACQQFTPQVRIDRHVNLLKDFRSFDSGRHTEQQSAVSTAADLAQGRDSNSSLKINVPFHLPEKFEETPFD